MKWIKIASLLLAVLCLAGCAEKEIPEDMYPIVTMELENGEKIVVRLDPGSAPNTVANFVTLVQSGFYDGLTFHRAVPGFVIQGGSPSGDGYGGPGYSIAGEFISNGFTDNRIKHERGVISMARSQGKDTAGSQFFICVDRARSLDGDYAAFGEVIEGMDTVDAIVQMPTTNQMLDKPVVITKMSVETYGQKYNVKKLK